MNELKSISQHENKDEFSKVRIEKSDKVHIWIRDNGKAIKVLNLGCP